MSKIPNVSAAMAHQALKVTVDKTKRVIKAMDTLHRNRVLIGVPGEKTQRDDAPITNAAIGYINENGSPDANIPARPHLKPGVRDSAKDYMPRLKSAGRAALAGDDKNVVVELKAAGIIASVAVKKKIREIIPPPLSEVTLEKRRARGVSRTTPLIDTAAYLNSITSVLRKR